VFLKRYVVRYFGVPVVSCSVVWLRVKRNPPIETRNVSIVFSKQKITSLPSGKNQRATITEYLININYIQGVYGRQAVTIHNNIHEHVYAQFTPLYRSIRIFLYRLDNGQKLLHFNRETDYRFEVCFREFSHGGGGAQRRKMTPAPEYLPTI